MPPIPLLKNLPAILHNADCRDLDFTYDEDAHHINMRAHPGIMI
jgi:hypothetical protein